MKMIEEMPTDDFVCDYPENLRFCRIVIKAPMPTYVTTTISSLNKQINCLIFAFQPPMSYPMGNEAYPVAINLDPRRFKFECVTIFRQYKEMSNNLCEKLTSLGYSINHDTGLLTPPFTHPKTNKKFR